MSFIVKKQMASVFPFSERDFMKRTAEHRAKEAMVYTVALEKQGKRVYTIGPERVYTIEASDPERRRASTYSGVRTRSRVFKSQIAQFQSSKAGQKIASSCFAVPSEQAVQPSISRELLEGRFRKRAVLANVPSLKS